MAAQLKYSISDYVHGRCQIFALALNLALKYKMVFLWDVDPIDSHPEWRDDDDEEEDLEIEEEESEPPHQLVHAYCVRPNGTYVDASGTITADEAESNHGDCWDADHRKVGVNEVKKLMQTDEIGKPDPGELQQVVDYIKANLDVYQDGTRKIEVA